jgi:hypothetical protein
VAAADSPIPLAEKSQYDTKMGRTESARWRQQTVLSRSIEAFEVLGGKSALEREIEILPGLPR